MKVVVDTDVVSFLFRSDTRSLPYESFIKGYEFLISFMTEAELERWVLGSNWGPKRLREFHEYLRRFTIIPSSHDLSVLSAEVMVSAQRAGRRIEVADAWIAASVLSAN